MKRDAAQYDAALRTRKRALPMLTIHRPRTAMLPNSATLGRIGPIRKELLTTDRPRYVLQSPRAVGHVTHLIVVHRTKKPTRARRNPRSPKRRATVAGMAANVPVANPPKNPTDPRPHTRGQHRPMLLFQYHLHLHPMPSQRTRLKRLTMTRL